MINTQMICVSKMVFDGNHHSNDFNQMETLFNLLPIKLHVAIQFSNFPQKYALVNICLLTIFSTMDTNGDIIANWMLRLTSTCYELNVLRLTVSMAEYFQAFLSHWHKYLLPFPYFIWRRHFPYEYIWLHILRYAREKRIPKNSLEFNRIQFLHSHTQKSGRIFAQRVLSPVFFSNTRFQFVLMYSIFEREEMCRQKSQLNFNSVRVYKFQ